MTNTDPESIQHFHVHVIPRGEGDLEKNEDIYVFMEGFDRE